MLEGETFDPFAHGAVRLDEAERDLAKRLADLTPQQFRVLTMLCEGKLNKQIASALQVSERTIKTLRAQCMDKLGATSAAELGILVERMRRGSEG